MNKLIKTSIFILIGMFFGFGYYYFIGCDSGCQIQSNWLNSTLYGGLIGLVLGFPSKNKKNNPQ
jgi:hypothetical protein